MVRSRLLILSLVAAAMSFACLSGRAVAETELLDFTSTHCGPCREMEPTLRKLAANGYRVRPVDVDREGNVAAKYHVDRTPTFIVLVDGKEFARLVGGTSYDEMVKMLQHSEVLAAKYANRSVGLGGGGMTPPADAPQGLNEAPSRDSNEPQDERVVPIDDPFRVRQVRGQSAEGAGGSANSATGVLADRLVSATVRVSVSDPDGKSTGTGTIVDARNGMALVLTCGHLFRESKGNGAIELSLFTPGADGAVLRGKVAGEVLAFDLERDLAFVRFRTASQVTVAPVAPPGTLMSPGAAATSVGCCHGDNPTAWATRLTAINRYQGHPNVEAAGAPVEGRSGGGLFNAQGQLIGVCFAAEPKGDEGLYSSLASIHAKLDELQMSAVYQSPSAGDATVLAGGPSAAGPAGSGAVAPASAVAGANPFAGAGGAGQPSVVRGQDPMTPGSRMLGAAAGPEAPTATVNAAMLASLTPEERSTLEEIARRSKGGEVICIIQPQTPGGKSDVIKLSGVTPEFVQTLMAAGARGSAGGPAVAAAPGATRR